MSSPFPSPFRPSPSASVAAAAVLLALAGRAHAQFYDYKVIAKVGQAGLTGMGDGPSINDGTNGGQPRVAFIGQTQGVDSAYEGVFVGDGTADPANISPGLTDSKTNFFPSAQINSDGKVISRTLEPNPDGVAFTNIWRWDADNPGNAFNIAGSAAQNTPFRAVNGDPTMNDSGVAVWGGLDQDVKKVLATGVKDDYTLRQLTSAPVRPMLSDFGQVVTRLGNAPTDPISLLNASLTKIGDIATSANFASLGQSPGISSDAAIVVFAGDLTAGGAASINAAQAAWNYANGDGAFTADPLTAGPGIFASVKTQIGRLVVRIAGIAGNHILDPGETYIDLNGNGKFDPGSETDTGPCASFSFPDGRVAVNSSSDDLRAVTVCYLAADSQGRQGLYSNRLNFFGTDDTQNYSPDLPGFLVVGQTATVVTAGDTIPGLAGTVTSIGTYDPVNNRDRGDIVFYAATSSSAGIVRARPVQVVFLDFNPVANFRLNPDNAALFAAMHTPAVWAGNIDSVFSTLAPNRADLKGQTNLKNIENGIVDLVQKSYDALTVGGFGVKVKVLGKVGEAPPPGGPYIRVSIGDGPNDANNPDATSGIANLDIFNQKAQIRSVNGVVRVSAVQGSPLIFADNTFRTTTKGFTTEDPADLHLIGLDDTGPHKITVANVINAVGTTIAHEVGHNLGLSHIDNAHDELLMNAYSSSLLADHHPKDEFRYQQVFGLNPTKFEPHERPTGQEAAGPRLAFTVGSDTPMITLKRDEPPPEVLDGLNRVGLRAPLNLGTPVSVARAAVGIVPSGIAHSQPYFLDLGAGDLQTLLDQDLEIGIHDSIILIASTDGNGIDIFGVRAGFGGDVSDIDLSSALSVLADGRIRAVPLDDNQQPLADILEVYQQTQQGPKLIGSLGDPQGNPGPLGKNDQAQTAVGQSIDIAVLTNDTDADGLDKASVIIAASPASGGAAPDPATGKVLYTPVGGFAGVDTFRYTVRDTLGAPSNEATVTITVSGGACYADFDGNGTLDLFDFLAFVNAFNAQDARADCTADGSFDLFDFLCFVNAFNGGC